MIRKIAFVLLIFLFGSCSNKTEVPKNIFPPEKMEQILWDLIRADETMNIRSVTDTSYRHTSRTVMYEQVMQIHKVTKNDFKKSFTYYQNHPDLLKIVLDSMYSRATSIPKLPPKKALPKAK